MSTFTTNKNIEKPGNGEYVNTWNVPVNADLDIIDAALGGVATVGLTNVNVTLTTAQSQNLRLKFTGTLTGNVIIFLPAVGGIWIVDNQTTGAFTVTIKTVAGGSVGVAVNQSVRSIITADATNVYFADDRATGTITSVTGGTGISGGGTSGAVTLTLANTAVTPGTYGSATQVAVVTVDAQGRATAASNTTINILPSQTSNAGKALLTDGTNLSWGYTLPKSIAGGYVKVSGGVATLQSGSLNIASVTRSGVGKYDIVFTTNATDVNYWISALPSHTLALDGSCAFSSKTVSGFRIDYAGYQSGSFQTSDCDFCFECRSTT